MVDGFAIPRQPEPGEIFELAKLKLFATPIDVQIVDAQSNLATCSTRVQPCEDRGPRVPQMQITTRRWCVASSTHPASLPEATFWARAQNVASCFARSSQATVGG